MLMSRESNDGHHIALCLCHFLMGGPASFFFKVFVTATNDIFKMFFFPFCCAYLTSFFYLQNLPTCRCQCNGVWVNGSAPN